MLSFDLKFGDNVTISVALKFAGIGDRYVIKYTPVDNLFISQRGNVVYLGYGVVHVAKKTANPAESDFVVPKTRKVLRENSWHRFTRSLLNDLMKGISRRTYERLYKESNQRIIVEKISFEGRDGCVTNLSLSETEYMRMFFHAADWLVENQDTKR